MTRAFYYRRLAKRNCGRAVSGIIEMVVAARMPDLGLFSDAQKRCQKLAGGAGVRRRANCRYNRYGLLCEARPV